MTPRQALLGLTLGLPFGLACTLAAPLVRAEPELRYVPPAAGSYELPPIDRVSDHALLAADGRTTSLLAGLEPGQVALVSFIYRSCTDAGGCPLALAVLQAVDRRLVAEPDLAPRVRLVTVSFDPAHDTPPVMAELARSVAPRGDWRFLTARDASQLQPVLRDFGQDATPLADAEGQATGQIAHVLKVFLIDDQRAIRNVYSTGFLHSDLVLNDARTILGLTPSPVSPRKDATAPGP